MASSKKPRPEQRPYEPAFPDETYREGLVISSVGIEANVEFDGLGDTERCRQPPGQEYAIVGDRVRVAESPGDDGNPRIVEIHARRSVLKRPNIRDRAVQNIAANIDRLIVVAAVEPRVSHGVINRYAAAAEAQGVEVVVALNKIDLKKSAERFEELGVFRRIGYAVIGTSAESGEGLTELRALLSTGASVLAGHSGVGKSSLLRALLPGHDIRVGEISEFTGKGKHTTTTAVAYRIGEGLVIDTPGIREFGLADIPRDELHRCFREFRDFTDACKFANCLHLSEPGCAVKAAAKSGEIAQERYDYYVHLYDELTKEKPLAPTSPKRSGGRG